MSALKRFKEKLRQWKLAGRDPIDVFNKIYSSNKWGDPESRSGKGSNLVATEKLRAALPDLVRELGAQSFLDLPCGDYFWMNKVDLGVKAYMGGDIVAPLIAENQRKYGRAGVSFEVINLIDGPVPQHDVVFVRDCLVHLSNAHIAASIRNLKASKSTWLVATTYPVTGTNEDISTGQWRALDLTKPPFSFPLPERFIDEAMPDLKGSSEDKAMGVWRLADLPDLSDLEQAGS